MLKGGLERRERRESHGWRRERTDGGSTLRLLNAVNGMMPL